MGRNVFVIDDDPAILRLSTLILRLDGHHVDAFESATEALNQIESHAAEGLEVIVLDLNMPQMTGFEFYHAVRKAGFASSVVLVSAFGAESARESLGATAALGKPFTPEALSEVVRNVP